MGARGKELLASSGQNDNVYVIVHPRLKDGVIELPVHVVTVGVCGRIAEFYDGYPGIGTLLFQGIKGSDFFLVQGIVFIIIIAIGVATLILDLAYPLLDPRIVYRGT